MPAASAPEPTTALTLRLPVSLKERFEWMAQVLNRSDHAVYLEALRRYLEQEEGQLKDILEGLDEAAWQEGIPHGEVMEDTMAVIERARVSRDEEE